MTAEAMQTRAIPLARILALSLVVLLTACATRPYNGTDVGTASFIARAITQQEGELVISAAVPDAAETETLTNLDLYDQGIQPVWIKVENRSESQARLATWSIDREYFSPIEVAYMNRKKFSSQGYDDMQRWFYDNGLPRFIPPGETRSGLVFTHLRPGTKGFNLTVFNNRTAYDFTFFVPLPGFVADFMAVDFANLYAADEIQDFDPQGLKTALEELECCATDPTGELQGGPFNAVLVGTGMAVRRAMLRGGWLETAADKDLAVRARQQRFRGRQPDAIFTQMRRDGNERIQLHLWMAPWRTEGEPVWLGQVFYVAEDHSLFASPKAELERILEDADMRAFWVKESVSADIDSAVRFLFQNIWYNGSLSKLGFVGGVPRSTLEEPARGFGGVAYFTDGGRMVAFLSEEPMALDESEFIYRPRRERDVRRGIDE